MSVKSITVNELEFIEATKVAFEICLGAVHADEETAAAEIISFYSAALATVLFDGHSDEAMSELEKQARSIIGGVCHDN